MSLAPLDSESISMTKCSSQDVAYQVFKLKLRLFCFSARPNTTGRTFRLIAFCAVRT